MEEGLEDRGRALLINVLRSSLEGSEVENPDGIAEALARQLETAHIVVRKTLREVGREERDSRIYALRSLQGKSAVEIAEDLGLTRQMVHLIIKKQLIQRRTKT